MELVRIWTELFYDITYFTARQEGIVADFKSVKNQAPKILEESLLVVNNAHKTYVLPATRVYALRGVSFVVKSGEFIAIMGPSGAGKTTLINVITGLDSLDKGEVYLNGQNIALMNDKHLTEFRRDQIGLVFQFYQLFGELTALENVTMPAEMAGVPVKEARERGVEILSSVGLEKFAHQYPDKLSGGQQQRVAIARALINNPAIIVADQITGDLDSVTGQQVINLLKKFNKEEGKTILLATHNKTVARQADRILHIEDGEIIEETDMKQLRAADNAETDVFNLAKAKKSLKS
ncbi:MAG: ATP-binding cassette domain-containing protein [Candidatus Heimdallarchaeota archaeon]|nr:ATP-binding cassette domain-containing protein [Candidatus Heimdallarchaeota archaeon]